MRQSEGVFGNGVDGVKIYPATEEPEHGVVDQAELQDRSKKQEPRAPKVTHHGVDGKEHPYEREGENDLGFGEITHWLGEPGLCAKIYKVFQIVREVKTLPQPSEGTS